MARNAAAFKPEHRTSASSKPHPESGVGHAERDRRRVERFTDPRKAPRSTAGAAEDQRRKRRLPDACQIPLRNPKSPLSPILRLIQSTQS